MENTGTCDGRCLRHRLSRHKAQTEPTEWANRDWPIARRHATGKQHPDQTHSRRGTRLSSMNRLLSVVRSRTDKSVELSRALLTSRLSMGNGCAEARLWRGREVLHACRNAGARIDAGSGQGSTWLRKAAMTGSATASLSRATGASVGRTSGRYGIGIVGSGRIVTAALALRSGTRSRAAFREGAFAATGPVHTVRRR